MKNKAPCLIMTRPLVFKKMRALLFAVTAASALTTALQVEAASQTWTNAPVDATWTNVLNWVGKAVPGALGVAGGAQNADVVTFTNPIPLSGIGSGANPIINDTNREVNSFIFDATNCGAYVFGTPAANLLWLSATLFPGGSINVNPAVTNPIAFYAETHFRLQSSQNGGYNITNNATSTNGTLYFDVLWPDTASSRPLTLTLAGSNTGTNTIRHIDDNTGANGSIHLVKEGSGTWILPQANDIPQKTSGGDNVPGSVAVNNGLLIVRDPGSLGTITVANLTVTNTGVLQIDGVSLNNSGITLRNGGTVRMNGSGTVNGITVANAVNTSGTLATTSASDVMTVGNAANKVTGGAATTTLHMTGPGTVIFDAANNYVGKFSLDSGTNQLTDGGALGVAANYNINAGGVLDVTLLTIGSTYTYSAKAMSANGTGTGVGTTASTIYMDPTGTFDFGSKVMTLTYSPATTNGDSTHPVIYAPQGTLSFNGNAITVVNTASQPLNVGTYKIVQQAGGAVVSSGAFVTIVTGNGLAPGMVGEIVASGSELDLLVYAYTPKGLVWTGNDPLLPGSWDRQVSTNFLNGGTPSVFNIYDSAIFNATGIAQPTVSLASILVPGGVVVDTSAGSYTFNTASSGQIAGGTSLFKTGANTLFLNTANTYSGGTVISNGVIKIGIDNAIPSTGLGDVTNVSPAVIDLNGFADTIGALDGNGTVDVSGGGTSTLSLGANDNSGTFTGILTNSAGTLNVTKLGLGTQVLTRSNSYAGNTDIELGTLKVMDPYSIGGGTSPLVINGGTLDMATNIFITSLAGAGGTIANQSTTTTNMITVTGSSTTTFGGSILTGSGKIALTVLGGSLRMTAANTYSNGTFVGSGATFQIHNSPAAVTGPLVASNTATLGLSGGSSTPGTPTTVTTVDGATVTLTSGAEGEIWTGQFIGSATTTNRFVSNVSAGGIASFSNFLGVVQFALASGNFRFFNGGGVSGGDNTTFEFDTGNVHTRDAQTVSLGSIRGGSGTCGIGGQGAAVSTWAIGAKNQNDFFEGYINGSNNVVKMGTGTLQLDGTAVVTNTDSSTYTNYLITPLINYLGSTTVSNGVMRVVAPNSLTNCTTITVATVGAVLDASQMGYVSNQLDDTLTPTNSIVVTNGILVVPAVTFAGTPQTLAGFGTVKGNGVINNGTINPGNATTGGTLSISNGLTINAGATNIFDLSDDLTGLVKASDSLTVQGNVTLSGASIISIGALNGVVKVGKYPLIKYSGNLINEGGVVPSGPISNFALGGIFPATSRATMVLSNAPGEVDLIVVSLNAQNLTWAGDGISNRWDVVNSFTFTNTTVPIQFYQLDFVTFDNTSSNLNVSLQGTLVPSSVTVNTSTNYAFGGPGSIGGTGGLLKTGTGTLLLTNGANTYTGGTVISNGLLSVGADSGGNQNDQALGTGSVTVSTAGAELRFGGNGGAVVNHSITNAIILNGGVVKAQDGIQHLTNSTVTVAAGGGSLVTVFATKNLILDSPLQGTGNVTITAVQAGTNAIGGQVILSNALNTISGTVIIATNGNLGLIGNAGLSNSAAIDVQTGGILDVTVKAGALLTVVSGQTLKGNGVIRGSLNMASGSTLSPGITGALGTLSVTNVGTLETLGGTTVMELNRSATPNSDRLLSYSNLFSGTLTVNNIGAALQLNDTFTLFTSVTNRGAFAVTNLPALPSGLGWSNSLAINGKLTVIATVNPNPTNIVMSVSGNVLTLSWPADHTGWRLQVQTNALATGLRTNWVDVPNSVNVNSTNITVNPANGTTFYRLTYP